MFLFKRNCPFCHRCFFPSETFDISNTGFYLFFGAKRLRSHLYCSKKQYYENA